MTFLPYERENIIQRHPDIPFISKLHNHPSRPAPFREILQPLQLGQLFSNFDSHSVECCSPNTLHSVHSSSSSDTLISPSTAKAPDLTPTTRRRLAVEGLRKAASNAALRKIGLSDCTGWVKEPVGIENEENKIIEDIKPHGAAFNPPEFPAYFPRHYAHKPLLLPSKLARNNSVRSPFQPIHQRTASHPGKIQFEESSKFGCAPGAMESRFSYKSKRFSLIRVSELSKSVRPAQEQVKSNDMIDSCLSLLSPKGAKTQENLSDMEKSSRSLGLEPNSKISTKSNEMDKLCTSPHFEGNSGRKGNSEEPEELSNINEQSSTTGAAEFSTGVFRRKKIGENEKKILESFKEQGSLAASKILKAAFQWAQEVPPKMHPGVLRRPSADDVRPLSFGCWTATGSTSKMDNLAAGKSLESYKCPTPTPKATCPDLNHRSKTSIHFQKEVSEFNSDANADSVARPVFLLPTEVARSHVWNTLRELSSPPVTWKSRITAGVSSFINDLEFPQVT
ncbi:expressed protein [Phakopsora pachyrhizi]|uniref:Expressed protein n=1 Tax=Phakopsora pachyrhizi TaxID=170000 RepID=A0AAV0BMR1_PHAPC|nr:expressed protein [Phakopsora pachyrhizi]